VERNLLMSPGDRRHLRPDDGMTLGEFLVRQIGVIGVDGAAPATSQHHDADAVDYRGRREERLPPADHGRSWP
jgi:hypothetical protein